MKEFLESLESFVSPLGTLGAAIILGLVGYFLLFKIFERLSRNTETILDDLLVKHCLGPSRLILPLLAFYFLLPFVKAPSGVLTFLTQVFSSLLIVSMAWLVIKLTSVLEDFLLKQYRIDVRDNLMARRIHTQILSSRGEVRSRHRTHVSLNHEAGGFHVQPKNHHDLS